MPLTSDSYFNILARSIAGLHARFIKGRAHSHLGNRDKYGRMSRIGVNIVLGSTRNIDDWWLDVCFSRLLQDWPKS